MGDRLYSAFEKALSEEPSVSIRLNRFKVQTMPKAGVAVPWCPSGMYMDERPAFTFDPLLHAGAYYVQEASSMFVDRVLRQYVTEPVRMLDMCAAPGGKSTAARAALPEGSLLMANEPMRQRANILMENIAKQGHPDVIVTNNYPKDYRKSGLQFDVILTDVPCSGEGMFRKDEGAVAEWSVQNVRNCQRLQREIVADAWQCLRPGGMLIYSTCTFNLHEDEENALWIMEELGGEPLPVDIDGGWGVTGSLLDGFTAPVYRFIPGRTRGEGLFLSVFRKYGDVKSGEQRVKKRMKKGKQNDSSLSALRSSLSSPDDFTVRAEGDSITAIPLRWADLYDSISGLRILHAGVPLGKVKGKDIVPAHALALSTALNRESFPSFELKYDQAIAYLRREAVNTGINTAGKYVLMTYQCHPLGFVKHMPNRDNNLYPQEWRIKSGHVPDDYDNIIARYTQ